MTDICRICRESYPVLRIVCDCRGSTGYVHYNCIDRWIATTNRSNCEICQGKYKYINYKKLMIQYSLTIIFYISLKFLMINKFDYYIILILLLDELCINIDKIYLNGELSERLRIKPSIIKIIFIIINPISILVYLTITNVYITMVLHRTLNEYRCIIQT